MSLQEQLAIFKQQQQEKCQSTLSRSAPRFATSSSIASGAHAVQFSNDTERLLRINSIRKAPMYEEAFTVHFEACYIDVINNRDVFYSLTNNPKVFNDGERFSYKVITSLLWSSLSDTGLHSKHLFSIIYLQRTHDIKNKTELLSYIRKFPEAQVFSRHWLLSKFDSLEDIAYPNNPKIAITVDDELQQANSRD
ncbi:hypothetical protein MKW92_012267 [Papaver armeniacum]|nr:hypothetical protein MKW92_012267 [Papaver armeniacum]